VASAHFARFTPLSRLRAVGLERTPAWAAVIRHRGEWWAKVSGVLMNKNLRVVWNAVAVLLVEALLVALLPLGPLPCRSQVALADSVFTAQADTTPPYVTGRDPAPGQTGVAIDSNIVLHIKDDGEGVSLATISLLVDGAPVNPAISGTPADYTLTYNPAVDFGYSHIVNVTVTASDVTGNAMSGVSYYFATEADTTTPYVSGRDPAPGATGVPVSTSITAHVLDDDGVDISTIAMTVEAVSVTPQINGTVTDYTLTYSPSPPFGYSQVVDVTIDASDLAGNAMPTVSYSFTTQPDTPAPYTSGSDPAPGETGVAVDTSVVIHVLDDGEGVDATTLAMTVEGVSVSPIVTGTAADYTLTYVPAVAFSYSQVVDITVDASDLAGNAMPTLRYSFTTEPDTTPPYVSQHDPSPGQADVVIATNIVAHVLDDGLGVDIASLTMRVDGVVVGPSISGTPADYTLTYNPPVDFDYSQVVTVKIDASDLAGNAMTTATYSFATLAAPDTDPPHTAGHDPSPGQTGVIISTNVVVHVVDDGDGVDMATITMTVEGEPVTPVITGTPADYTLTYNPALDFDYSQVVDVRVTASDLAGNAMATATYSFTTQGAPDSTAPSVSSPSPAPGESDVPVNASIVLHVLDTGDGVDVTTLAMTVDGVKVTPLITGTPADYVLTYNPAVNLAYSRVVTVTVNASDLSGNAMAAYSYSFTTEAAPDISPPYVSRRDPTPGSTRVSVGTNIVVDIVDDGDGVDISSLTMTVKGVEVSPLINGTPSHYTLTYNPAEDFDYSQVVTVAIDASDLAGNPMATCLYSFATQPATPSLHISGHRPAPGATDVAVDTSILLHVVDDIEGVDVATIAMTVEGVAVTPVITGSPADYTLTYDPPGNLGYSETVDVTVNACDLAGNAMPAYSYSFTTEPDTVSPYITQRDPAPGQTGVAVDASIRLHVMDDNIGVDISTITMTVDGVSVRPAISGTPSDYTLSYNPATEFGYCRVVTVQVGASDLAGNKMATASYSFATEPDTTPPHVAGRTPSPGATGVSTGASIVVHLIDAGEGVAQDTIDLTVGGVSVSPVITGTPADYTLTYTPKGGFDYSDVVEVEVDASDLAGNAMDTCTYSFTIEPDTTPPYTSGHAPAPGETEVPLNTSVVVHVLADGSGVDISTITMTVGGTEVSPTVTGSPADYTLTYSPSAAFGYCETIYVTVDASDLAGKAMPTESYFFTTVSAPNRPPDAPTNVSPANGATDVSLAITLVASEFSDPDATSTHFASLWQLTNVSGDYSAPVYETGVDATALTSLTIPAGTLAPSTTYYWRVKYGDNANAWSDWSQETSFTTQAAGGMPFWIWLVCGLVVVALLGVVGWVFIRPRFFGEE